MLKRLHVRDLAIVDSVEIDLGSGFTVFSGETGAGKSILVEALALVLGGRGDADAVRDGCARAVVTAEFDPRGNAALAAVLSDLGAGGEDECIVQRQVGSDGRSRATVNGTPVPISALARIADTLVDIHGQHAHQLLLRRGPQRELLDAYGNHAALLEIVADLADQWRAANAELEQLRGTDSDVDVELERLRFQARELEGLPLTAEAISALEREHRRAANASRLVEGARAALTQLEEGDASAADLLAQAQRQLDQLARLDERLAPIARTAGEAAVAATEAARDLGRYLADLEVDPVNLGRLERELGVLTDLSRKHRCAPTDLAGVYDRIGARIGAIEGLAGRLAELDGLRTRLTREYADADARLHTARADAAARLAKATTRALSTLGMAGAKFGIEVRYSAGGEPARAGTSEVEFMVSANPGQPLRPLAKVASGGELSRLSLAIEMVTSGAGEVGTLVFDEVDSGIGGRTAAIVGRELRRLGERRQVLCVTHLPQVASAGHRHFAVEKVSSGSRTSVSVRALDEDGRTAEVARMLGGVQITAQTLAHAREMLAG